MCEDFCDQSYEFGRRIYAKIFHIGKYFDLNSFGLCLVTVERYEKLKN